MKELNTRQFMFVLYKASSISFVVFAAFLLTGSFIFTHIFQISFESFRIFGGVIIFSFAYMFIVKGERAWVHMKPDLEDVAAEVALPFMVGAGTISVTMLIGFEYTLPIGMMMILLVMTINFMAILFLKFIKDHLLKRKLKVAFDKNMEILLRVNGFFVGAIGVNMIVNGVTALL